MQRRKAKLTLKDGQTFFGYSFGFEKTVNGEVVFNTGMVGYPETLTDPSYYGEILVLTYPLVGNYGVPKKESFESDRIHIRALIVSEYSEQHSHWNAQKSLSNWLKENKVPGIYGIDTRELTKILREKGTMLGKIEFEDFLEDEKIGFDDPNKENLVEKVSKIEKRIYGKDKTRIVLVDCGAKQNIIRCLVKRGATVIRVPWDYKFQDEDYDGLLLSNGPGDPKKCTITINNLKEAMKKKKPIFGICLGNQLLALACGADTYKMKYGHRSQNQPCVLTDTNRCFITSQNHGFAVDEKSLPKDWKVLFRNANDGTVEGIRHKKLPFFSVQFHPEACPGPTDTEFLFDEFLEMVKRYG